MNKRMEPPWSEWDRTEAKGAPLIGRYPFKAVANEYLRVMDGVLANSTHKELTRRLDRMNKDLMKLKEDGSIMSCNPYRLTDKDVLAYISLLRSRGMHDSGIDHNIDGLAGLLKFVGNGAVDKAKRRYKHHFPHGPKQRLDPISDEDRQKILDAAEKVRHQRLVHDAFLWDDHNGYLHRFEAPRTKARDSKGFEPQARSDSHRRSERVKSIR